MNIKDFLFARITEDEENAGRYVAVFPEGGNIAPAFARILAECAAKRAIAGLADEALEAEVKRRDASALGADLMHQDTLRALASVYSDHADYQQEWALDVPK